MKEIDISLFPEEYFTKELLFKAVSRATGIPFNEIAHIEILHRSLDSRRSICYHTHARVFLSGEEIITQDYHSPYKDCHTGLRVIIIGAGPAGLFAALHALELGIKPIIIERGKPVEQRKKDITQIVRTGNVNSESNWCFGEGGAGTFSDGKLYTRSTKRGNTTDIIKKFIEHGADPSIIVDSHAHIGTDRLSGIIATMRETIISHGGEILFGKKMNDLVIKNRRVTGVVCQDGDIIEGKAVVLATGHSARDIFELFFRKGWTIESKPFALGVRVEHPQKLIDDIQYHGANHSPFLPPAAYSLQTQVNGHGVFSFCMCPGGIIVPAATSDGEQVVNGMSNASRSSAFANSGIAVTVSPSDLPEYEKYGPLALLRFQQDVERRVSQAAGGGIKAPGQRLTDFCESRATGLLNKSNYMGEYVHAELDIMLPPFVTQCLRQGFILFGKKMHGFYTEQASLLAVESRTSSPVRIPRGENGEHPMLPGLYPCGEGAGYAGGIVSSAMDGVHTIDLIASTLTN